MKRKDQKILANDWEALLKKHSKPLEKGAVSWGLKNVKLQKKQEANLEALTKIKSLVTPGGDATKAAPKIYSGDKILGIATMHKSNMIPIFNSEAAIEVAQMRRN